MIVDTSALVSIVKDEPEKAAMMDCLSKARVHGEPIRISAATLVELGIVVDRFKDERLSLLLDELIAALTIEVIPVDDSQAAVGREANRKFGKGFHPARLNFGDCFAYALTKLTGEPLLFKGKDFSQTDIEPALK